MRSSQDRACHTWYFQMNMSSLLTLSDLRYPSRCQAYPSVHKHLRLFRTCNAPVLHGWYTLSLQSTVRSADHNMQSSYCRAYYFSSAGSFLSHSEIILTHCAGFDIAPEKRRIRFYLRYTIHRSLWNSSSTFLKPVTILMLPLPISILANSTR